MEILSFIDDQHVEAPALGNRRCREARLEPLEFAGYLEVGRIAAVARDPVAQLVVVRDFRAGRRDARDVVGERPVETHVEHALAGRDRIAHRLHRELRLARAGRAGDAQPERREFELARPRGGPARQPRDERAGQPTSALVSGVSAARPRGSGGASARSESVRRPPAGSAGSPARAAPCAMHRRCGRPRRRRSTRRGSSSRGSTAAPRRRRHPRRARPSGAGAAFPACARAGSGHCVPSADRPSRPLRRFAQEAGFLLDQQHATGRNTTTNAASPNTENAWSARVQCTP